MPGVTASEPRAGPNGPAGTFPATVSSSPDPASGRPAPARLASRALLTLLLLALPAWPAPRAQGPEKRLGDLTSLSLEELMEVEVTTAGKKEQRLQDIAAAVYVVSQEDLRRSGVMSLSDALRLVPGLQVARIDAGNWAIASRGFASQFSNKLLVLIDGRSVYTPLFSGVYWDVQDLSLEDVERIEVIRGPGSSLWGTNAVNGVINIITKHAEDTRGTSLTGAAGTSILGLANVRHGGALGASGAYRVVGRFFDRDQMEDASGRSLEEGWDMARGAFRADWEAGTADRFLLEGDVYDGENGQILTLATLQPPFSEVREDTVRFHGYSTLGEWSRALDDGASVSVQAYADRYRRALLLADETRRTFDLEVRHHALPGRRHDLVWGGGYRLTSDEVQGSSIATLDPRRQTDGLLNVFLQDEIALADERLRLTLGSKIEHNEYTGFDWQPNARIAWRAAPHTTLWGAVSRADRLPSRAQDASRFNAQAFPGPGGLVILAAFVGNRNLDSEDVTAYECGLRWVPEARFSLDATVFFDDYRNVFVAGRREPFFETDPPPPHLVVPATLHNDGRGRSVGAEVASTWQASPRWRLMGWYAWIDLDLWEEGPGARRANDPTLPRHQAQVRSYLDLPGRAGLDAWATYVSRLDQGAVPDYVRLDLRLSWRPRDGLELAAGGRNLLEARHFEFGTDIFVDPSEVERSVYGSVSWRF